MAKTAYGYAQPGGSGGSTGGGSYSGGTGISVPKIADFKRDLENSLKQKLDENGGIVNLQLYEDALKQVEPYIEDSQYLAYYLTLKDQKDKFFQITEDQRFEGLTSLSELAEQKKQIEITGNLNPNLYIQNMNNAYLQTATDLQNKIDDYSYAGLNTDNLKKALDELQTDYSTNFEKIFYDYENVAKGDISQMGGYGWQITTNSVNGSLESAKLVKTNEIKQDNFAFTNANFGGLPVYVSQYIGKDNKPYVPVQGYNVSFNEDTKQFEFDSPELFNPANIPSTYYPEKENGTVAKDSKGNLYYKNKDGWYKAETPEDMSRFYEQSGPNAMSIDFADKSNDFVKNLYTLSQENVAALGNFENPDGTKRIINKDFLGGYKPFSDESVAPENKVLNDWNIPIGPLNVNKKNIDLFGKAGSFLTAPLRKEMAQPIQQLQGVGSQFLQNVSSITKDISTPTTPIQTAGKIIGTAAKAAAEIPRKDFVQKATTGLKGMFNTAKSIFGFK